MTHYSLSNKPEGSYTGYMKQLLRNFWKDEQGQEMVEYVLLTGFFALAGAGALSDLRTEILNIWQAISASYAAAS